MHIIGLSGKKQCGKDTVCANIIAALKPHKVYRLAFADELKYELAEACGVSLMFVEFNKNALRLLLQSWGTDFRRNLVDKDYWIKKLAIKLARIPDDTHSVIIPDVRFLNEANFIKEAGGKMVRVFRGNDDNDAHISETELDNYKFDYTIHNSETLDTLSNKVKEFLFTFKIK